MCALVEGSETVQARAAEELHAELVEVLAPLTVGLVHGRQKSAERAATMRAFAAAEVHVLVATTVIEVGIDVPNATAMVIEDADRFGLSQLHQLRGRVGRGSDQSYCFLFESPEPGELGQRRLQALCEHASGFDLAELDLRMRGEGELAGLRQSGASDLRHASLSRHRRLISRSRADARFLERGGPVRSGALRRRPASASASSSSGSAGREGRGGRVRRPAPRDAARAARAPDRRARARGALQPARPAAGRCGPRSLRRLGGARLRGALARRGDLPVRDDAAASIACVRANVEALGLEGRATVRRADFKRVLRDGARTGARYDLVLLDPPYAAAPGYAAALGELLPPVLAPGALIAIESAHGLELPLDLSADPPRRYGASTIQILRNGP